MHAISVINRDRMREYYELTKPRVVFLLVFTAVIGMFLATPGVVPWPILFGGGAGIWLCSSCAAVLNQWADREADARMARTRRRPLPTGSLSDAEALGFAAVLGVTGAGLLYWLTNPLTMWLTLLSLVGYAVVYTLFLKRATPQNIVIGGAAGAAPPLLGWTAVTGEIHAHALILFLIIFAWTPPHFWALAIDRREEYAKAGIPMLPVTHGVHFTSVQILLYTAILFAVSLLPFVAKMSGWLYLAGALPLGGLYLLWSWNLLRKPDAELPRRLFNYSIVYLMAIFALLLLDHYLLPLS